MASLTPTTAGTPARRKGPGLDARPRVVLPPAVRARLEDYVARAIAILDAADGNPDAESDVEGEDDLAEGFRQPLTLSPDWIPPVRAVPRKSCPVRESRT